MHQPTKITNKLQTFQLHYPFVGPALWIASIQYFIVMSIAGMFWPTHYSILNNTISDLGNTACGIYDGRYVCSPLHALMNASFILLGATMVAGSSLIYHEFRQSYANKLGFNLMGIAGIGVITVGIFAENTIASLHDFGAALPFVLGNISILILGLALDIPRYLKLYSLLTGTVSLIAFGLFATHNYLGIGIGGMERLAAHPQTLWLILFGIYVSSNHFHSE